MPRREPTTKPTIIFFDHNGVLEQQVSVLRNEDLLLETLPGIAEDGYNSPETYSIYENFQALNAQLRDLCDNHNCKIAFMSGNTWEHQLELLNKLAAFGFPVEHVIAAAVASPTVNADVPEITEYKVDGIDIKVCTIGSKDTDRGKSHLRRAIETALGITVDERSSHKVFDDGPTNVGWATAEGYQGFRVGNEIADEHESNSVISGQLTKVNFMTKEGDVRIDTDCHYHFGSLTACMAKVYRLITGNWPTLSNNPHSLFTALHLYLIDKSGEWGGQRRYQERIDKFATLIAHFRNGLATNPQADLSAGLSEFIDRLPAVSTKRVLTWVGLQSQDRFRINFDRFKDVLPEQREQLRADFEAFDAALRASGSSGPAAADPATKVLIDLNNALNKGSAPENHLRSGRATSD